MMILMAAASAGVELSDDHDNYNCGDNDDHDGDCAGWASDQKEW